MKLWRRAAGALKDQNSLLAISLSRQTWYRNSDLEAAIVKATNHDESYVDYRNAQRVFTWIRTSPVSLKPLIWALTTRMEKTRNWAVAIKGLMLIHGVFCCKTPAVQRIGRLPFDLSNFTDGHSKPSKIDQTEEPMDQELVKVKNLQYLLDMLLKIKPMADNMKEVLITEAMDCVIIEIYDVYSRICKGIARVLMGIYSAGKLEATMALKILHKANVQGEDLALYFEFCRNFGVFNALEVPKVTQIPEADIKDLERIINGVPEAKSYKNVNDEDDSKAIVVKEDVAIVEEKGPNSRLKTIITDKWEIFEEDVNITYQGNHETSHFKATSYAENPPNYLPIVPVYQEQEIPDFICF
ncbi:CLATHRIN ASSEMBLY PROTEIN [Salix koriyanagi]|uniref:CLATHRIN ASSEMBLY PROTEIN n=1 Tax=Salix koriyanagi TaxID=2511006 RepID=A0A9Q1AF22_9ROSI|nr:CLATHRIN ASSEMBLY PROTEIN [Salix koriyanagi]